jgi:hypothetical protein
MGRFEPVPLTQNEHAPLALATRHGIPGLTWSRVQVASSRTRCDHVPIGAGSTELGADHAPEGCRRGCAHNDCDLIVIGSGGAAFAEAIPARDWTSPGSVDTGLLGGLGR